MHLCKNIGSQLYKSCLQNTYRSHPVRLNEWRTDWLAEWRMELMKVYWAHGIDWAIEGAGDAMWWSGWMGGHFAELNEFCQLSGNGNTAPTIRDVWGVCVGVAVQLNKTLLTVWRVFHVAIANETLFICPFLALSPFSRPLDLSAPPIDAQTPHFLCQLNHLTFV